MSANQSFDEIDRQLEAAMKLRVSDLNQSIEMTLVTERQSLELDYQTGAARSQNHLGLFRMIQGDFVEAEKHANAALKYFKGICKQEEAAALYTLASINYKSGKHHQGLILFLDSLQIFKELNDLAGQSRVLKAVGYIYEINSEQDKALETYLECRRLSRMIGDKNGESNACNPLSGLYLKKGDIENAFDAIETSIRLKHESGDVRGLAFAYFGKGKIHLFLKELDEAERLFNDSLAIHRSAGELLGTSMCLLRLGILNVERGNVDAAVGLFENAVEVANIIDNSEVLYKAYYQLYLIYKAGKKSSLALKYHELYYDMKNRALNLETSSQIKSLELIWKMESLEAEAKAQKYKNELIQKKNEELDRFVARVSHDLKGPITSIMHLYEIIKSEIKDKTALMYFGMYNTKMIRLNQIIGDLLELSKVNTIPVANEPLDFEAIISDCLNSLNFLPNYKRINFSISVAENLNALSDKRLMNTIFQNLLENSIKYSKESDQAPFVNVTVSRDDEQMLSIVVEDNGTGIDEKYQSQIFDMFYRANDQVEGTGLGMYILKTIIDKLNGQVELQSTLGKGSRFSVILPV